MHLIDFSWLFEYIRNEHQLQELVEQLSKISTNNEPSKSNANSPVRQASDSTKKASSEKTSEENYTKSQVSGRLNNDSIQDSCEIKDVNSVLEQIKDSQKQHSDITSKLVSELNNMEKENSQLQTQVRIFSLDQ